MGEDKKKGGLLDLVAWGSSEFPVWDQKKMEAIWEKNAILMRQNEERERKRREKWKKIVEKDLPIQWTHWFPSPF